MSHRKKDQNRVLSVVLASLLLGGAPTLTHAATTNKAIAPNGGRQSAKGEVITELKELKELKAEKADIGTITELARQIQIERQRKELRELRAAAAAPASAPAGGPALSDPINLTVQPARSLTKAKAGSESDGAPSAPTTPVVWNIAGARSGLVATLDTGRKVQRGDSLVVGDSTWTVDGVTPAGVSFKRCAARASQSTSTKPNPPAGAATCPVQVIPVSSRS